MYSYLFFDLDGTLADSQAGILDSFRHAFTAMGTDLPPIEVLKTYIGPPLENAMSLYWPEEEACHQALKHFRTYYRQEGVYHCQRFTGVTDLLAALKAAGCQLYLTT